MLVTGLSDPTKAEIAKVVASIIGKQEGMPDDEKAVAAARLTKVLSDIIEIIMSKLNQDTRISLWKHLERLKSKFGDAGITGKIKEFMEPTGFNWQRALIYAGAGIVTATIIAIVVVPIIRETGIGKLVAEKGFVTGLKEMITGKKGTETKKEETKKEEKDAALDFDIFKIVDDANNERIQK